MKWLPYDSWTVDSPLDAVTLAGGMRKRIEPTKWFRWWSHDHTSLQGSIHGRGFSVSRIIHYNNSFLPVLYGTFTPTEKGTTIRVRMMLHPGILAFLACWFGFLGLFGVAGLYIAIQDGDWGFLLFIGGMGVFALILTCVGFWVEAGRAKRLLSGVLLELYEEAADSSVGRDEPGGVTEESW